MSKGFGKVCLHAILVCLVVSCGVLTKDVTPKLKPSDVGYAGNLEPLFYYTEGLKRLRLYNDPERAISLFDKALKLDSTHTPSLFESANAMIGIDPEKALKYSQRANELDTANVWFRSQLGRLMLVTNNYEQALDTYAHLVKEAPANPDNYRVLAALHQQNNQPYTAINVLDSAETKLGKIEELSTYKRQLLISVGLYDKAIEESRNLIRDYPYQDNNYVIIAELYAATYKDSLAMAAYNRALELNPEGLNVLASMNEYYKKKGDQVNFLATTKKIFLLEDVDIDTKIQFFNDLTKDREFYRAFFFQISDLASTLLIKYPNNYDVLELYAQNMIAYGSLEEALKMYKAHTDDSVKNISIFNNILDIEAYLNRTDSVAKYSDMALQYFPLNTNLYLRKGAISLYMKNDRAAKESYKKALKYATTDSVKSVVLGTFGDLYHQEDRINKSYAYYKRALRLWADNSMVLNNYAYFLSVEGSNLEQALAMSERVIVLEGSNPTYLDTKAWILYKLGRYAEAKKIMQQAISLDRSGSAELLIHYGDILYALEDYFMASVYWTKAKEAGYDAAIIEGKLKLIEGK